MVPVWSGTCYHLRGNYCSWNCAKAHSIEQCKAGKFPKDTTSLALFAFQISFRGRNCKEKTRVHSSRCGCYSRFTGVVPAGPKESLRAFGGDKTIENFRRGALTIDDYAWVTRYYSPRELTKDARVRGSYLYTLEPLKRVKVLDVDEEGEDPVVLIKRRVY